MNMTFNEYRDFVRDNYSCLKTTDIVSQSSYNELKEKFLSFGIDSFFKYASLDNYHTIENIKNDTFHLSTLMQLNDPLEYVHVIDEIEGCDFPTSVVEKCREIKNRIEKNYEFIKGHTTICSLTTTWSNRSMWGTYASSFKGVCIEFDAVSIWEFFKEKLFPVVYSDIPPKRRIEQMIMGEAFSEKAFKDMVDNNTWKLYTSENGVNEQMKLLVDICTTKNADWSNEKEWRITNIATNILVEQNAGLIFKGVSELKPKAVILGSRIDSQKSKELLNILRLKEIKAYKLKETPYSYELTKEPIEYNV